MVDKLFLVLLEGETSCLQDLVALSEKTKHSHFEAFLVLKEHQPAHIFLRAGSSPARKCSAYSASQTRCLAPSLSTENGTP